MNTQVKISDDRQEFLDALAERIDDECKSYSEYVTENSDYAEPLFYSDWTLETANLRGEELGQVERLFAAAKERWGSRWESEVKSGYCDTECVGIGVESMEVCSFSIGEVELQLSDEIYETVRGLSKDEIDYLQRQCREGYVSDTCKGFAYLSHDYDRWVLILNAESLAETLEIDLESEEV